MITPQQIEQVSFRDTTFNGYNKHDVDEFLEPLVDDYIALYKENALLKSKMRVLVAKLEEYRQSEASLKDAVVNAQKTCDLMVKEAEGKCYAQIKSLNEDIKVAKTTIRLPEVIAAEILELEAEIAAVEDAIKAVMGDAELLTAGAYKVSWKTFTSSRLDSTALKKALPEIAAKFTKTTTARRFSIN